MAFPKQCGKRASAVLTNDEIEIYLNEWLYSSTDELNNRVKEGLVRKADFVEKVLTGVDARSLEDELPNRTAIDSIIAEFRRTELRIIPDETEKEKETVHRLSNGSPLGTRKVLLACLRLAAFVSIRENKQRLKRRFSF